MSQEQPPIRSRRELRKARDAAQGEVREAGTTGAGEVAPASKAAAVGQPAAKAPAAKQPAAPANTGRVRRVAPGPVDSVPAGQAAERSSQVRARDRAALRTIKELAEKEGQLSGGGPPTRRQLRLMELEKAVTSAIPVVPPASGQPNPAAPAQGKTPAGPAASAPSAAPARPAVQGQAPGQAPAQPKTAPQAAGDIHTYFDLGFIRVETIGYDDFVAFGGETGAREKGRMRLEGKDYLVKDGDVLHFRFNV